MQVEENGANKNSMGEEWNNHKGNLTEEIERGKENEEDKIVETLIKLLGNNQNLKVIQRVSKKYRK